MNCSNHKFNKKTLSHAISDTLFRTIKLASIPCIFTLTLTGCQSSPTSSTTTATQLTPTPNTAQVPPTLSPSQNAHRLMTDMMIHRFEQAYDVEKTTQYHAYPLYAENDIEKNDQSLWFTLLKGYADKKAKTSTSDDSDAKADEAEEDEALSPAEQKCNNDYEKVEAKNLDNFINKKISEKTYDKRTAKNDANYEKYLQTPPC